MRLFSSNEIYYLQIYYLFTILFMYDFDSKSNLSEVIEQSLVIRLEEPL